MKRLAVLSLLVLMTAACATTPPPMTVEGGTSAGDMAAILTAVNEGEIALNQLAQTRATSGDVRSFAQMMVTDHQANLDRGRELFTRLGVTPTDNAVSQALRSTAPLASTNLQTYSGAAFDRTHMRFQADLHQWALNALDVALIPSANNAELRDFLTATRASIAAHLDQARRINP